jgi:hypothetical protein
MSEKRLYPRYKYSAKAHFRFFEGDPDVIDAATAPSRKGNGRILDISKGGASVATNSLVSVNLPIILTFRLNGGKKTISGNIVRTGKIDMNPSALARAFSLLKSGRKYFIGVRFNEPLTDLDESSLA